MRIITVVYVSVYLTLMRKNIFFFQAEDGIRDYKVTGVQTCALPICHRGRNGAGERSQCGAGGDHGDERGQERLGGGDGRSGERRGGEEGRSRGAADHLKKKNENAELGSDCVMKRKVREDMHMQAYGS